MIIVLGLVILIVAVVVGVAGVVSNTGGGHAVTNTFAVFGHHVTGSTGTLFLYGAVVGGVAVFGLSLLLSGARRTSRRGSESRRDLNESRRQTVVVNEDRESALDQRDTARADTVDALRSNGSPQRDHPDLVSTDDEGGHRLFRRRSATPQPVAQSVGSSD
jgi:hypothetical protein